MVDGQGGYCALQVAYSLACCILRSWHHLGRVPGDSTSTAGGLEGQATSTGQPIRLHREVTWLLLGSGGKRHESGNCTCPSLNDDEDSNLVRVDGLRLRKCLCGCHVFLVPLGLLWTRIHASYCKPPCCASKCRGCK